MAKKKTKPKTPKQPTASTISQFANADVENVIAATLSNAPLSVLMKVCRLCEMKDGPFLNIFDADKVTAKKIDDLMPFEIAENDDLPHKICFRCSAKVEELHEFIQKCIKTQENLRSAMGKQGPLTMKSRRRVRWEQHLHKTKSSNDDICDVLIKRAMEGIPLNAPLNEIEEEKSPLVTRKPAEPPVAKKSTEPSIVLKDSSGSESESESEDDDDDDDANINLKQVKQSIGKAEDEIPTRTSRSNKSSNILEGLQPSSYPQKAPHSARLSLKPALEESKAPEAQKPSKPSIPAEVERKEPEKSKEVPPPVPKETAPPFNIMDHVSTIKVNGVGILFQCKLCVRNFLKKDIVMNHGCAKNNAPPKETNSANASVPGPPKPSTVKYIKMDKDPKKLSSLVDKTVEKTFHQPSEPVKPVEPEAPPKPRPKVGPASRIRPKPDPPKEAPKEATPPPKPAEAPIFTSAPPPSVSFPITPSLNSRYKLVPGPNNTFQLVEESCVPDTPVQDNLVKNPHSKTMGTKQRSNEPSTSKSLKTKHHKEVNEKLSSPDVIDLDENNVSEKTEPYPVGLFQPVPHHSSVYSPSHPPVPFTTPAMKKQSYTIVQTGNPSKLLISTKPQPATEEPPKKKLKKKTEVKEREPHTAASEDNVPPKDSGFFTFVSLDPLLQPSYVLPTDNIIQESQITTSTGAKQTEDKEKDKYPCNMCGETFSREKKLLTHIQSHYNQMDEEDEKRVGKPGPKRRTRKS